MELQTILLCYGRSNTSIVSWNDYDKEDGKFAGNTDAMALSIGFAQYANEINDEEKDISLKVWRKPNERWSRQSEELPIHRNLDLTILLLTILTDNHHKTSKGIFANKSDKIQNIKNFCLENEKHLNPRFEELYLLLSQYLNK